MKHLFTTLVILMIFYACQNKEKAVSTYHVNGNKITKIDINLPIDSSKINLSALAENLRVVRLETSDSCLFGNASYLPGEKYIIAFSSENIIQFDRNGKYIRTLSVHGRGPGEFSFIINKITDKQENLLFAINYGQDHIDCWSLSDGQYRPIPLSQKGAAHSISLLNDTTLEIANHRKKGTKYKLYSQTLSGRFLNGILNTANEDSQSVNYSANLYNTGTALYCKPHHTDSIFQVLSDTLMLKYTLPINQKHRLDIQQLTDQQFIFTVYHFTEESKKEINVDGQKIQMTSMGGYNVYYILDLLKEQIICSRRINNDYLGTNAAAISNFQFLQNGQFYLENSASKLISLIPKILEKKDIDVTIRQRLEQLKSEITEEDNPILIIGTSKPFVIESR